MSLYNPESIESKWQEYWMNNRSFVAEQDSDKPKYYVLCMFPYPSGSGLHVGHPLSYTSGRYYRTLQKNEGIQCIEPDGLGCFWFTCRTSSCT